MTKTVLQLQIVNHKGTDRIFAYHPSKLLINNIVKRVPGARYSATNKSWHLPLVKESVQILANRTKEIAVLDVNILRQQLINKKEVPVVALPQTQKPNINYLCGENKQALNNFTETLILKAYSQSTIKTYRNEFYQLLKEIKHIPAYKLTIPLIRRYILYCIEKHNLSEATIHSRINAIKFYYEQVLGRERMLIELPRPKKPLQLPRFFSREDISSIIKASGNLKHKVMLMLAYSAGLRVSEVVSLKTACIDSKRMSIFIENAKGKKDRIVR